MAKKQFSMNASQKEKYAELFSTALDTMEAEEWRKPWVTPRHTEPQNLKWRRPYRGMNNFLLTLLCAVRGWEVPLFMTFKQMQEMGLELNIATDKDGMAVLKDNGMPKYESAFPVVKMVMNAFKDGKRLSPKEYDELTDEERDECRRYFSMHAYPEFNVGQTDFAERFPERWAKLTALPPHNYERATNFILRRYEAIEREIHPLALPVKLAA